MNGRGVDLVAVGEVMLELTSSAPLRQLPDLRAAVGGDTFNVAAIAARLGTRASYVGLVGDDPPGDAVLADARRLGVDTSAMRRVAGRTGLYLVTTRRDGERTFTYYRHGSAGAGLGIDAIETPIISRARALHTSGITLALSPSARAAGLRVLENGARRGALTSYDVNFRAELSTADAARRDLAQAAPLAGLVSLSLDEARLLCGATSAADAVAFAASLGAHDVLIGEGSAGATLGLGGGRELISVAPPLVTAIDTTAAGDALVGAFLHARLRGEPPQTCLALACAVAARSVTGRGALGTAPSIPEAADLVREVRVR